jgi:oligosaccharide repeat unit polymerase
MQGFLIFLCSSVFMCGTYLVWPSRYNVMAHLNLGFIFIAYFIPAVILKDQNDYANDTVSLYTLILGVGAICFIIGLYSGFLIKPIRASNFSFSFLDADVYKQRIVKITAQFLIIGIIGQSFGYLLMGFVPAFAADPVSAKFFRGPYQVPFYVSIIYLSSFFILTTITPIAIIVWYTNKKKKLFLLGAIVAIILMAVSLSRGPAFSGLVLAIAIVMSFKNRLTFTLLIVLLVGVYLLSSVFYFVVGVRDFADVSGNFKDDHVFWRVVSAGTVDITDQLTFMDFFKKDPVWTYGRTILGGLVPSHYQWNPAIYTLSIVNPGEDPTTLVSGGLRLPAPIWGYVSFQWFGVIIFCFLSGFLKGILLKFTKYWIFKSGSMLIATVLIVINISVFAQISDFFILSIYALPPLFVLAFYTFRIRIE